MTMSASLRPYPGTPPIKPKKHHFRAKLSGVLRDILSLISSQNPSRPLHKLQYFTIFVLTDGEFGDIDECSQLLTKLSMLQVSVIFIGIGKWGFIPP